MGMKRCAARLAGALTVFGLTLGCGGPTPPAAVKKDLSQQERLEFGLKNLDSKDPVQRLLAIGTVGNEGAAAKEAIPKLKELAKDPNPQISDAAKDALKKIEAASGS